MLFGLVPVLFSLRRVAARGQASRPGEAKDMPAIVIVIVIVMVIVIVIAIVIVHQSMSSRATGGV